MARPEKKSDEKKGERAYIRWSAAELEAVDKRRQGTGLTRSEFCRRMAVDGRVTVKKAPAVNVLAVRELNPIGVNVNQIARKINELDRVPLHLVPLIERVLDRLETSLMKLIEAD
jgi:hypothetical protein